MHKKLFSSWRLLPVLLSASVLALLVVYIYAFLAEAPYSGFYYNPTSGEIVNVYVNTDTQPMLQKGDVLEQIGPVTWEQYHTSLTQPFFENVKPGQVVDITVARDGAQLTIPWVFPGLKPKEFTSRLLNNWWLALFFWFFGMVTQFFMRPKDTRWRLLIAANYLMSFWLVTGNLSTWRILGSSLLLHAVTWLMLPVFLNFHWIFPKPLGRISNSVWYVFYGFSALLALGQYFKIFPGSFYLLGFLLLLVGSIILLIIHYVRQADQRREIGLLALALLVAVAPLIIESVVGISGNFSAVAPLALLALPIMPGAYVYVTFRRHLGGMELRANRIIAIVLYGVVLLSLAIPVAFLINSTADAGATIALGLLFTLLLCLGTAMFYPFFQRWVERRLLRMPMPPASVLESYMARITTSMERKQFGRVIGDEVFPSLLIRQAALLRLEDDRRFSQICTLGVTTDQLPDPDTVTELLAESGKVRSPVPDETLPCPWARLVLALKLDGKPIGLCLFGRRDPDDYYAVSEIPTLQALMDQSALAIVNIEQAERLRALYLADIERQEAERNRLAFELHDDVLGQMALLAMNAGENSNEPKFTQAYHGATDRIRQIISGLWPTMLSYGLWSALDELADTLKFSDDGPAIKMEIPEEKCRYPENAELHLFRMVQQACQNSIQHAQAKMIRVAGNLQPDCVELVVEDDGVGFAAGEKLDLPGLLAGKHFGLAGMFERAALIGARVKIESEPGRFTRVSVNWRPGGSDLGKPVF